jgi:NIMA (never in mitosis gene a)-related kinase
MEYLDGGDLSNKIQAARRGFPEPEVLDIMAQIALALIYIQSKRILHRDVKPANIFMTKWDC